MPIAAMRLRQKAIGGGFPFWRILVSAVDGGAAVSLAELRLQESAGGASVASGGTAFASSEFPDSGSLYAAFRAFDGNLSTIWASASGPPQSLGYQLPTPLTINAISIIARPDGGTYGQTPASFIVQSSADGVIYADEWTVTGSTGWAASELRQFVRP